jgi:Asp-tRNA(Asn)/Glu-tRNA(Gln) amidotransferase A subunit family amidase
MITFFALMRLAIQSCKRSWPIAWLARPAATAAVAVIRNGDIKAEDYARALLDRAQQLASLNAFRILDPETVLEAARNADRRRASGAQLGALHGLPIPVKDSVNAKALPTSNGTRALANFKPKDDAAVLKPLFAQGAILMGKTNLHPRFLPHTQAPPEPVSIKMSALSS